MFRNQKRIMVRVLKSRKGKANCLAELLHKYERAKSDAYYLTYEDGKVEVVSAKNFVIVEGQYVQGW